MILNPRMKKKKFQYLLCDTTRIMSIPFEQQGEILKKNDFSLKFCRHTAIAIVT